MERNVPIIIGGLVALVGIVYIVYQLDNKAHLESPLSPAAPYAASQAAPPEAESQHNLFEETSGSGPTGATQSKPTSNPGITGSPTDV